MRSDERRDKTRIGMYGRPDRAWEIWREPRWREDPGDAGPWQAWHPGCDEKAMPNLGGFATWREAMDFVCEYERAQAWDRWEQGSTFWEPALGRR